MSRRYLRPSQSVARCLQYRRSARACVISAGERLALATLQRPSSVLGLAYSVASKRGPESGSDGPPRTTIMDQVVYEVRQKADFRGQNMVRSDQKTTDDGPTGPRAENG